MIARIWHGMTSAADADEYFKFVCDRAIPDYKSTEGNRGAFVLRRVEKSSAHFLTLSFWDSIESIKRFAGENYERAKYYPEDKGFLLEFEERVRHYEVEGWEDQR